MIEIAIHYYVTAPAAGDFGAREGRQHAPAVVEQSQMLRDAGMLAAGSMREYEATEGCRIWIEALCAVPFPVQRWVIPSRDDAA